MTHTSRKPGPYGGCRLDMFPSPPMTKFAQWLNDWRWAANMRRARAWRRDLMFSQRLAFDDAFRPRIGTDWTVIAYPDAIYHTDRDDLCRAIIKSGERT